MKGVLQMPDERLFKLESKEEILRMKAIYRFIREQNLTPEKVIEKYLTPEEKEELIKLNERIITESIKPFIEADIKEKQRQKRKEQRKIRFKKKMKKQEE